MLAHMAFFTMSTLSLCVLYVGPSDLHKVLDRHSICIYIYTYIHIYTYYHVYVYTIYIGMYMYIQCIQALYIVYTYT